MKHEEDSIQRAICDHLRTRAYPGVVWFHVPNGGRRNAREAARLKGLGVTAGVADIILLYNRNFYALELKAPKGRPTEAQLAFRDAVSKAGGYSSIAWGLGGALASLETWGLIRPEARAA